MSLTGQLRQAVRSLRREAGFSTLAILTLGLGIGAAAAVYSVVDAVLLRGLPFADADRLVRLRSANPERGIARSPISPLDFLDWRKQARSFSALAAWDFGIVVLADEDGAEHRRGAFVTEDFFALPGTPPALGRALDAADFVSPAQVVVISDALWRSRFAASPSILGRAVTLNRRQVVVVGVMPPGFRFPSAIAPVDAWLPYTFRADDLQSRGARWLTVAGRMRSGVTLGDARAEMAALAARLAAAYPEKDGGWVTTVEPLPDSMVSATRTPLLALLGAVALLLLVACFNVAGLLAARNFARRGELALRAALGAGRRGLLAPLAAEGLMLAVGGGVLGLVLARWGRDGLLWLAGSDLPLLNPVVIRPSLLVGTLAFTLLAGLACSVLPAWPLIRGAALEVRRETAGARGAAGLRRLIVVSQVAVTLVLLAGAGLMARTLANLLSQPTGLRPTGVQAFAVSLPEVTYPDDARRAAFVDTAVEKLAELPGVQSVAATSLLPLSGESQSMAFARVDRPKAKEDALAQYRVVTPGLFATLGVELLRGRDFDAGDRMRTPLVAVVSAGFARRFFPGEDVVGRQILIGDRSSEPRTIVGVVGDVREELAAEAPATAYVPAAQKPQIGMMFVLRSASSDGASLLTRARATIAHLDRGLPIYRAASLEQVVRESLGRRSLVATLLAAFAVAALVLAVVGLYAVVSFQARQRWAEIGLRAALGARRGDLLRLVLGQGLRLAALGVALGVGAALALGRVLGGLLFGVTATDPSTLLAVSALLLFAAAAGCWVPAVRASRLDPMTVLREE